MEPTIDVAAHDVLTLMRHHPGQLLWYPGRTTWGLALVRGTSNVVLALDGCLDIAATMWPGHYPRGGIYAYASLVRALQGQLRLGRMRHETGAWSIFRYVLPGATSGAACLILALDDLPWIASVEAVVLPAEGDPAWQAPSEPASSGLLLVQHPWLGAAGQRPAEASPAAFYALVGEPSELWLLPPAIRTDRLVVGWRQAAAAEKQRLVLARQPVPAWLDLDDDRWRLARAWVGGWRGPDDPGEKPQSQARRQEDPGPRPVTTEPPANPFGGGWQ